MASRIRPSAEDYEKKKIAIAGVIDFNDANGIKYSRVKLFKHFGVGMSAGYAWFPIPEVAEGDKPGRGRPKSNKNGVKNDSPSATDTKKRRLSDSENSKTDQQGNDGIQVVIKVDPDVHKPSVTPRQNPTGNAGRGRKKLKGAFNNSNEQPSFTTPPPSRAPISPPPSTNARFPQPEQLLTPPPRKRGRPKKVVVEAQQSETPRDVAYFDGDFEDDEFFAV